MLRQKKTALRAFSDFAVEYDGFAVLIEEVASEGQTRPDPFPIGLVGKNGSKTW